MPIALLANAPARTDLFADILPWMAMLLGLVVVGGLVIFVVRRYGRGDAGTSAGFTLHDLRTMHAAGELSDEEFARAREALIGRTRAAAEPPRGAGRTGNDGPRPDAAG
jgi:hypothetical protein